jgi:hypothetical protein
MSDMKEKQNSLQRMLHEHYLRKELIELRRSGKLLTVKEDGVYMRQIIEQLKRPY